MSEWKDVAGFGGRYQYNENGDLREVSPDGHTSPVEPTWGHIASHPKCSLAGASIARSVQATSSAAATDPDTLHADEEEEVWKSSLSAFGYEVSSLGRVRSTRHGLILHPSADDRRGYEFVNVQVNGQRHHYPVHRLVAEAFCPNPDSATYTQVNHKDDNPANNRADNLEWCTPTQNTQYIFTGRPVINPITGQVYPSVRALADALEMPPRDCKRCIARGEPALDGVTYQFQDQQD